MRVMQTEKIERMKLSSCLMSVACGEGKMRYGGGDGDERDGAGDVILVPF